VFFSSKQKLDDEGTGICTVVKVTCYWWLQCDTTQLTYSNYIDS